MRHVGFSPLILTKRPGRKTCERISTHVANGKCPPCSNGHGPVSADTSGSSLYSARARPALQKARRGHSDPDLEQRHQLGLDSYDRFFPSQDTMPKGGFGNLIALSLQHMPRSHGNSVFIDIEFNPHPDRWPLLSAVRRMEFGEVGNV